MQTFVVLHFLNEKEKPNLNIFRGEAGRRPKNILFLQVTHVCFIIDKSCFVLFNATRHVQSIPLLFYKTFLETR